MIEQDSLQYRTNNYNLLPHDTFSTEVNGVYKKFKITNDGDPQSIFLNPTEDTTFNSTDYSCVATETKNIRTEIISITEDKVVVEMYLPDREIQKSLKQLYIRKLKELDLYYEGANFDFVFTETEFGQTTEIQKIDNIKDFEAENFIKQLQDEIGY